MKLARELERRLERLVDGATAAVFRGRMHPVDIADRLIRHLDFSQEDVGEGPEIPNDLTIRINPHDLDPELDLGILSAELANAVSVTAAERGWRLGGPISVTIEEDRQVPRGLIDCVGRTATGHLEPWGYLVAADRATTHDLADNRIHVGRGLDNDIVVGAPEISRRHAVIARDREGISIRDLGSANGTYVNGQAVTEEPAKLRPGDQVVLGDVAFTIRWR